MKYTNVSILAALLASAAGLALAGESVPDQPDTSPLLLQSCAAGFDCPNTPGHVVIDAAFDENGDGQLSQTEIQCAVDCLDGDRHPEWSRVGAPYGLRIPHGGTIEFLPVVRFTGGGSDQTSYQLTAPLELPMELDGPLTIAGNGARIVPAPSVTGAPGFPLIRRRPWIEATACNIAVMAELARDWRIADLELVGPESPVDMGWKGLELTGTTGLVISRLSVRLFHVGIDLRQARAPVIESSGFGGNKGPDVQLADANEPWTPGGGPAWSPSAACNSGISGCSAAVLRRNWHLGGMAIRSRGTTSLLLDQQAFEPSPGGRWIPDTVLVDWGPMDDVAAVKAQVLTVRSLYVENHVPTPHEDPYSIASYFRLSGRGTAVFDGLTLIGVECWKRQVECPNPNKPCRCDPDDTPEFIDSRDVPATGPGLDIVLKNVPWGTGELRFAASDRSRYWLQDAQANGADMAELAERFPNGAPALVHVDELGVRDLRSDGDPCPASPTPLPGRTGWLAFRNATIPEDPQTLWVHGNNGWDKLSVQP